MYMIKDVLNVLNVPKISITNFRQKSKLRSFAFARQNSVSESFFRWRNTEDAALEMMNMSPAILNYTVKFNQTVAAVQYNDTNSSFSSLHCVFISRSLRFFTPESPRLFQLRFSSLRCDGFDFRAEVRIRLCFSVILHPHRLKTEGEKTILQIYGK